MIDWGPGLPGLREPLTTEVKVVRSLALSKWRRHFGGCLLISYPCPQVEMGTARALGEVTVLGSLLLQHLLHFSTPGLILRSLGALTGPQLLTLAQSPAGSHVLDAVLTSPSVTRKQRRRVLKTLKVKFWLLL